MKIYFKILFITAGIQIITFLLSRVSDQVYTGSGKAAMLPVGILIAGILVSTLLGIILPLRWYGTKREKILGIILLITNYTGLILAISVAVFAKGLWDMLTQIPDNFG